jgi:PAS domain S-box-containing protein
MRDSIERPDIPPSFTGDPPAAAHPEALPDRRELALVAVERTRMPMVVTDARRHDNPIVLANDAFLKLTGYTADEILGKNCRFLQGPETNPADIEIIRSGLSQGAEHISVELLNYRKNGSTFWNQLSIMSVVDDAGEILYHFASQKDVTARRRAEELEVTERLLLMEVDHRAMNVLALVQSIVRQSRTDNVASFAKAVQSRIDALAGAHRLLALNGWSGADIGDLVRLQTDQHDRPIALSGPPLAMSPDVVQPMAMVFHELLANTLQHGAFSRAEGHLEIRWNRNEDAVWIGWSEDSAGLSPNAPEPGFGLKIIQAVIERQLGGSVALTWRREGLRAELSLPAASTVTT